MKVKYEHYSFFFSIRPEKEQSLSSLFLSSFSRWLSHFLIILTLVFSSTLRTCCQLLHLYFIPLPIISVSFYDSFLIFYLISFHFPFSVSSWLRIFSFLFHFTRLLIFVRFKTDTINTRVKNQGN